MKWIIVLFCVSLFSHSQEAQAGVTFTTVFLDDEGVVYVGLKQGEGKGQSQVISFPFNYQSADRTNIPLPEEIAHRDVIGLLTEKRKLFVITNGSGEKGDGPMVHLFDRKNGDWKKIGKVDCPSFTKVNLKPTHMVFFCEVGKVRDGKARTVAHTLSFGKERIFRTGTWRFPEFLLKYKSRSVLLEGRAPTWDKLRLRSQEGDRVISAEDLFQLPMPAPVPVPEDDATKTGSEKKKG